MPATDVVTARLRAALAELHTETGWAYYDSGVDAAGYFTRALDLADHAVREVSQLHSVPTRQRLEPLAALLDARSGADARHLACQARQVAATRA